MSVNRYLPHLFVLPEDDANRQLATGFQLAVPTNQLYVLREAGGWANVRDRFVADQVASMRSYPERRIVLLIDFDGHVNRLATMKKAVPQDLIERVFVLGTLTRPEDLKPDHGSSLETIGRTLANECHGDERPTWDCELLRHNSAELTRLRVTSCEFLFTQ